MLKAIETQYKGYRFRSRLEARWAVFLDAVGLSWRYESEGFDLGDAGWYLPDFLLPSIKTWLEIKPPLSADPNFHWTAFTEWEGSPGYEKAQAFAAKRQRLIVLHGEPWRGAYFGEEFEQGWDGFYEWCECPRCGTVNVQYQGASNRNCDCVPPGNKGDCGHNLEPPRGWTGRIDAAFAAARAARFERGR